MTRLDTLNRDDLFKEISDLARAQGVLSAEMWNELTEEVIQAHLELAELDKDQDLEGLQTTLREKWEEYKREAQIESPRAIDEDPEAPHA